MDNLLDLKSAETNADQLNHTVDVVTPLAEQPALEESDIGEFLSIPEEISWEASHPLPEHAASRHLLSMGALALAGALVAWWQSSILVFLAVMIGLIAWWLQERHGQATSVRIDRTGLWLNGTHYPHAQLTSFDIHRLPDDTAVLSIKTNRWMTPHMHLPLGQQDPREVHTMLLQYVPEERHPMSLVEWWLRKK